MLVERYLALQRMRFGDRLRYDWTVAPDIANCLVPVLLLQPLVENAVVHGLDAGQECLSVQVDARGMPAGVQITVTNDGANVRADAPRSNGHGVGLATTRARLVTAHGDRASLTLEARKAGGAVVRIVIPRRTAEQTPKSGEATLQEAAV